MRRRVDGGDDELSMSWHHCSTTDGEVCDGGGLLSS
jgi:hypothetical protein